MPRSRTPRADAVFAVMPCRPIPRAADARGAVFAVTPRRRLALADGQAAVELVALLPLAALVVAIAWQLAIAGHAAWAAAGAARAAARAHAVGLDSRAAARAALPRRLERRLRVDERADGEVRVRVTIPAVLPHVRLGTTTATARFEPQGP